MFSDDFNDNANGWGHYQSADAWTIANGVAASGSCTGRNPNLSISLAHLGTRLRKGFRFGFRWQHNQNSIDESTPGMIFTLDPQGVAGVQWEVKSQISNGHVNYQFQTWSGDIGMVEINPASANDTWHEAQYIVYPNALTLIVDGVILANQVSHTTDLNVFDNPILSFYCEGNEGPPSNDPRFQIDGVWLADFTTLGIKRVYTTPALGMAEVTNEPMR